jgi:hypothetical protein
MTWDECDVIRRNGKEFDARGDFCSPYAGSTLFMLFRDGVLEARELNALGDTVD